MCVWQRILNFFSLSLFLQRYEEACLAFKEVLKMDSACTEAAQELMRVQIIQLMVCINNTPILCVQCVLFLCNYIGYICSIWCFIRKETQDCVLFKYLKCVNIKNEPIIIEQWSKSFESIIRQASSDHLMVFIELDAFVSFAGVWLHSGAELQCFNYSRNSK